MDNRQSIAEKKQAVIDEASEMFSRGGIDIVKLCYFFKIKVFGDSDLDPNAFNAKITCESSKYEIVFNSNHPFTRIRFSIAHELAHFILHQEMITPQGLHRIEDGSTKEKDADELAAAILMPEDATKQVMTDLGIKPQKIGPDILKIVASRFKVSMLVAVQRLRKLDPTVPYISLSQISHG